MTHFSQAMLARTKRRPMFQSIEAFKTILPCKRPLKLKSWTNSKWNLNVLQRGNFLCSVEVVTSLTPHGTSSIIRWQIRGPCSTTRNHAPQSPAMPMAIKKQHSWWIIALLIRISQTKEQNRTRLPTVSAYRRNSPSRPCSVSVRVIQVFKSSKEFSKISIRAAPQLPMLTVLLHWVA